MKPGWHNNSHISHVSTNIANENKHVLNKRSLITQSVRVAKKEVTERWLTEASLRVSSWMAGVGGVSYGRKTNSKLTLI